MPRHPSCNAGEPREIRATDGRHYRFCAHRLDSQRWISASRSLLEGMTSTGIGEVTMPSLILRSGYPVPVAAATSVALVAAADFDAAVTHSVQFLVRGEAHFPWNLIVWGAPGMAAGAYWARGFRAGQRERLA